MISGLDSLYLTPIRLIVETYFHMQLLKKQQGYKFFNSLGLDCQIHR